MVTWRVVSGGGYRKSLVDLGGTVVIVCIHAHVVLQCRTMCDKKTIYPCCRRSGTTKEIWKLSIAESMNWRLRNHKRSVSFLHQLPLRSAVMMISELVT